MDLPWLAVAFGCCGVHLSLCWSLRNWRNMYLESLAQDALNDSDSGLSSCWRVHYLITACELHFESIVSMQLRGLLSTYAIPTIAKTLKQTGGFQHDVQRRYADMEILIREFNESALDGPGDLSGQPNRAFKAIRRLNAIHAKYGDKILYSDMLYVSAVFATTPSQWMETRWSWRTLTPNEKECMFRHWMNIGREMNLNVDILWNNFDDCLKYKNAYEKKHRYFTEANAIIVHGTIDYFMQTIPTWIRPFINSLVLQVISSVQECTESRKALGLPQNPSVIISAFVDFALTVRAIFWKYFVPPRPMSWSVRFTSISGCPVFRNGESCSTISKEVVATTSITQSESSPTGNIRCNGKSSASITNSCKKNMHYVDATAAASQPNLHFSYDDPAPVMMYYPTRPMDFNNTTYLPRSLSHRERGYVIEDMGPSTVPPGETCTQPRYANISKPSAMRADGEL